MPHGKREALTHVLYCHNVWHQPSPRLSLGVLTAQQGPCTPVASAHSGLGPSSEPYFQGNRILEGYQEAGVYIAGLNSSIFANILIFAGIPG